VTVHFFLHAAISIPITRLDRFIEESPALSGFRAADFLGGRSAATSAPARALERVAAPLRGESALLAEVATLPAPDALARLRARVPAFRAALDRYLDEHGTGVLGRYDFTVPTLAEQPAALIPALLRFAAAPPDEVERALAASARRVEEAAARLRDPEREARFRSLVFAAARAYAVRDDNVQITFNEAFGLGRLALREAGRRLAGRGALADADDVFFLSVDEILAALRGEAGRLLDDAWRRRRQGEAAARTPPPRFLGRPTRPIRFDGLPPEAREVTLALVRYMREIMAPPDVYAEQATTDTALRGVAAVPGRYTGTARVLNGEADFHRLAAGDVLVCAMTSPAWAAVLPLAGALVTDHGGVLSHAAVIAREFGIPAVVATRHGTRFIPDGARVAVDGDSGTVLILGQSGAETS
jgi:pyruvate,water dikinase